MFGRSPESWSSITKDVPHSLDLAWESIPGTDGLSWQRLNTDEAALVFVYRDPIEIWHLNDTVNLFSAPNLSSLLPSRHMVCFVFFTITFKNINSYLSRSLPTPPISLSFIFLPLIFWSTVHLYPLCRSLLQRLVSAWCVFIRPCQALLNITPNPTPLSTANATDRSLSDQQFY